MESLQQLRGEGRADAEVLLYLNFSFQHVKTRNCFIPLLICFLHCSTSQCTLPLLPAALDVFLTILWRICASFRASKNSKTPSSPAWALHTTSGAAVSDVGATQALDEHFQVQPQHPT